MLRKFVVLATLAFCLSAADRFKEYEADADFKIRQKNVYDLLWHVGQPLEVLPHLAETGMSYDINIHRSKYNSSANVKEFLDRYHYGMLPRGQVFNKFYPDHMEEAVALFKLFYYALDYNTFFKTACWARVYMNEGQFVYAFVLATIYRPDTRHIRLPAAWELFPSQFFNNEIIHQAHMLKMGGGIGHEHAILANYSGWYIDHYSDPHVKLNYFTEDVGLNNYYYYSRSFDLPFWMSSKEYGFDEGIRGDKFFAIHQHLIARYYLERLSNGLGEIEEFDWNAHFPVGYYPSINHKNSLPFPQREQWSEIPSYKYKYVREVQDAESRLSQAIDSGFFFAADGKQVNIYSPEGFNILGNIIEGNADSPSRKFYRSVVYLATYILGFNPEPVSKYEVVPSALQYFSTSLRDPAFFVLYKRILNYFYQYKSHLPVYSHDELVFPGVKIESVEVDELVTYFDHFDSLINHAVMVNSTEDAASFIIKARQFRLNHKPYSYHIKVSSDKKSKAIVRLFLGPKYDEHHKEFDISENYMNFYELDQFVVDLAVGENQIDRSSHEAWFTVPDEVSSDVSYKKVKEAIDNNGKFSYRKEVYGFPQRLLLPKGRKEGMPFQLFAYISYFDEANSGKLDSPLFGEVVFDKKPIGFPLDRHMYGFNFTVPNMYFKDVFIFHKSEKEINLTV